MQENYPVLHTQKPLKPEYGNVSQITLTSDEFSIGRGLDNSVVITCISLSRKHCIIRKVNNEWQIEDFSSFGIKINGIKLGKGKSQILCENDLIQLDVIGEFIYKIEIGDELYFGGSSRKRRKLEGAPTDLICSVRQKFEESQSFEKENLEIKIKNAKHLHCKYSVLKDHLVFDMERKVNHLKSEFSLQIENLKGEKNEVMLQKSRLEKERDLQLSTLKNKINDEMNQLMQQIQKHQDTESELLKENNSLKEKLQKDRKEFLAELNKENSSKQEILKELEAKIKLQGEILIKEKDELERTLKQETEQLMEIKQKELNDLKEEKRLREIALQLELSNMKLKLGEEIREMEQKKIQAEQVLQDKVQQMNKVNADEKIKIQQLRQEKEEAQRKLTKTEISANELKESIKQREIELAALASERIELQAEQSSKVISNLQDELDKVKTQLETVQTEKNQLLMDIQSNPEANNKCALMEVGELMESELQCSICAELFVTATTLNCSHTFCKYCIKMWKKKKNVCPICRAKITSQCRSIVLDSFIEKMVSSLSDEMKMKREQMLKDRQAEESVDIGQTITTKMKSSSSRASTILPQTDVFQLRRPGHGIGVRRVGRVGRMVPPNRVRPR